MDSLPDIFEGLAALLRPLLPLTENTDHPTAGHVRAWFEDSPPTPTLQVAGVTRMESLDFGDGHDYTIQIEGVFSITSVRASQTLIASLIVPVAQAIESDSTPGGALFSRLQDDNTLLQGQAAAAASVGFLHYNGVGRRTLEDGKKVLIASWDVQVVT